MKILFVLTFIFLVNNIFPFNPKELHIVGNPKIWKKSIIKTINNKNILILIKKVVYNKSGNIVEEHRYDTHGKIVAKLKYYYNANRLLIKIKSCDSNDKLISNTIFLYNSNGQLVEELTYLTNGLEVFSKRYCYANKKLMYWGVYNAKGILTKKCIIIYDDNNNKVKKIKYMTLNNIATDSNHDNSTYHYYYNKHNLIKKIIVYNNKNNHNYIFNLKYDNKKNVIKSICFTKTNNNKKKVIEQFIFDIKYWN